MENNLQKVTKEWMSLERKTLRQRKKADQFYDDNLMNLIEETFIQKNQDKVTEDVDYLIVSVGTSYEPLVLSISLFRSKQILFLYTSVTETVLNKIASYCGLNVTSFQKCLVRETNPIDIYREIKQAYLKWNRSQKLYIDFTGGTKSMSAAAAMATLLMYRLLEMIGQRRLAGYNLYVSGMIYENVTFRSARQAQLNELSGEEKRERPKDAVFDVKKQLFPQADSRYLPDQISLLEGFILLSVLDDEILTLQKGTPVQVLKRIRSMVRLRNNSIFAHGLGPVPMADYQRFRDFVEEMFRCFCKTEVIDFEPYLQKVTWINPAQSKYYTKPEV